MFLSPSEYQMVEMGIKINKPSILVIVRPSVQGQSTATIVQHVEFQVVKDMFCTAASTAEAKSSGKVKLSNPL